MKMPRATPMATTTLPQPRSSSTPSRSASHVTRLRCTSDSGCRGDLPLSRSFCWARFYQWWATEQRL
eukprot:2048363-Pyramimonas_sp.AAC.1